MEERSGFKGRHKDSLPMLCCHWPEKGSSPYTLNVFHWLDLKSRISLCGTVLQFIFWFVTFAMVEHQVGYCCSHAEAGNLLRYHQI